MKAVNSWKSQGQQRRWFQKKERSSTLPAPQNVARKRNIPKLQRLKIIKIYKASESISFVGFKFPEGSGCRPDFSQRKHVGVSMWFYMCCALERTYKHWSYNTKLELCQNYHSHCKLRRRSVQSTPQERMRWTWQSTQSNTPFWVEKIHWQNQFRWCVAASGGNLDDRSGKSDAGCHSRGSASAAKWRYYQSLSGWRLEILHDFGCWWIILYDWWCYVLLPGTVPQEIIIYNYEAWSPFGHFHQVASFCCGTVGHQNWCWELRRDAKNGLGLDLGISKTAPWTCRCFCQTLNCLRHLSRFSYNQARYASTPVRHESLPSGSWDIGW